MSAHSTNHRAIIYCRVSHTSQGSIPDQLDWARTYAASRGLTLLWDGKPDVPFLDHGLSGDDPSRPGLARLEAFFRARHAAGESVANLVVWHIDRVSRSDTLDTFALYAGLRANGLRYVHTKDRVIDLHNSLDRTLLGIEQDHKANPFLKDHATRALSGMVKVVGAGFWVGRIPIGYRLERVPGVHEAGKRRRSGRLAIDPDTAPIIAELFRRYASGGSTTTLAAWLTTQLKPRRARAWSAQVVRQLLLNEVYTGTVIFGRAGRGKHVRMSSGGQGVEPIQPGDEASGVDSALVVRNGAPAIIDADTYRVCRERLESGRRRGRPTERLPLPLAGLGTCGHCGGAIHAVLAHITAAGHQRSRSARLICAVRNRFGVTHCDMGSTSSPAQPVLTAVLNLISERILAGSFAEEVTRDVQRQADERAGRLANERANLLRRIGKLEEADRRAAYRLASVDDDMVAAAQDGIRQVREELAGLREELARIDEPPATALPIDPQRVRAFFEACRQAVKISVDSPEAGALLNRLLLRITDGFTVYFKKTPGGRSILDRVQVHLPGWIASIACTEGLHSLQAMDWEKLPPITLEVRL